MYMCTKMKGSSRKKASKNITVKNNFFRPILLTLKKKNNKIQLCYIYLYVFYIIHIMCICCTCYIYNYNTLHMYVDIYGRFLGETYQTIIATRGAVI